MPIKVDNLSKRAGGQWLFRDVSLEVADGKVLGIFGPNGAAKGELLASLPGKIPATDQESFISRLLGKSAAGSRNSDRILASLNEAPGPILLEDPFSGLDALQKQQLADEIRKTAESRQIPVVFTSSRFEDVLGCCDLAALLADGYVHQVGTPHALYEEPQNSTVASFTGRVNLIEARRLTSSKSNLPEFQTIEGEHRIFTQKLELRTLGAIDRNVKLAIRPEQVVISFGASFPEDNLLRAAINDWRFFGPVTYVDLDCSGMKLQAMVTRLVGLNEGDECMVGLPPDRIRVLAD